MSVAYSSRLAYAALHKDAKGHLTQKFKVYEAVKNWPGRLGPTRHELMLSTGMSINVICARVNKLLEEKFLILGPMKAQEVKKGRSTMVETLRAVVYRNNAPDEPTVLEPTPNILQSELFPAA